MLVLEILKLTLLTCLKESRLNFQNQGSTFSFKVSTKLPSSSSCLKSDSMSLNLKAQKLKPNFFVADSWSREFF